MDVSHSNTKAFNNAVLEGFLRYAKYYIPIESKFSYGDFLAALGVTEDWLNDRKQWHSLEFHAKFHQTLDEFLPHRNDIAREGARYLYARNRLKDLANFAGLFLRPDTFYSKLPKAVDKVNLYNKFEFSVLERGLVSTTIRLVQYAGDPSQRYVNQKLCEAGKGSLIGILSFFGYDLLDLAEPKCVRYGHPYCEWEISWLNRSILKSLFSWMAAHCAAFITFLMGQFSLMPSFLASIVVATALLIVTRRRERTRYSLQNPNEILPTKDFPGVKAPALGLAKKSENRGK